jgi:hypothetical protein
MARLVAEGLEGCAHVRGAPPVPGIPEGPAAGFGQGRPLDAAAPSTVVCGLADEASGEDRAFTDVTDDQLLGLIGARQRLAARQHWELLNAVAELARRRPDLGVSPNPLLYGGMPAAVSDLAGSELAVQLHLTASAAGSLLSLAHDLTVKLPLTAAALRDGIIDQDKARTIALLCWPLSPEQAREAERIVFGLDGVEDMTWGMIRYRIALAVIQVDPDGARRRREDAERQARVELIPETSGNTQIAGRELPPAAALAADQNLDARARQLRATGVPGDMDHLRTLAYLEMLGAGSFLDYGLAAGGSPAGASSSGDGPADPGGLADPGSPDGPGEPGEPGGPGGPRPGTPGSPAGGTRPGQVPPGFAAKVNLTIPLATLLGLAERPGTLSRTGPIDPALARTLAAAAARDPHSTWCITVTGTDHRPVAHGCGQPPPRQRGRGKSAAAQQDQPTRDGPVYQPGSDHDPPGTGTIRLNIAALAGAAGTGGSSTGGSTTDTDTSGTGGVSELVFALENLAGPCDHEHEAAGHDPGVKLRHLTGILNDRCTFPPCRRPHQQCDYEHSTPYEQGGRTCLCQGGPVCRHNHRDKQSPGWRIEHGENRGWFRWTTASGRTYTSKPTQYPD